MHQSLRPGLDSVLRFHQQHGTEVVRYGGERMQRVASLRRHLRGRSAWVIPLGGSSWLGSVGFVNAGLEVADQVRAGAIPYPSALYVALGTMGTAAGLALGLALAGLDTRVQAIRVTAEQYANRVALDRLIRKTGALMHAYDPAIPADLAQRTNIVCRDEFFGAGYGISDASTEAAIQTAAEQLGLSLESTYSGKAMAALLHDVRAGCDTPVLFWNTYNSRPLEIDNTVAPDYSVMPQEFARYFD